MTTTTTGTVYLIHFARPLAHARHYLGWTAISLAERIEQHRAGRGARLLQVITAAGIPFEVVRTWPGGRPLERRLKDGHQAPRLCPLCSPGNRRETENGH
jgi:hypothetical protein